MNDWIEQNPAYVLLFLNLFRMMTIIKMKRSLFLSFLFLLSFIIEAGQKLPFAFDVNLAEKPSDVQDQINKTSAGLPDLPLNDLKGEMLEGPVTVWLWHEMAELLERVDTSGPGNLEWPAETEICKAHAAFYIPEFIPENATPECLDAGSGIVNALSNLQACLSVSEPEWFIFSYPPAVVNNENTDSVPDLIGVAGSALYNFPPLPEGIIDSSFVLPLRNILRKLRYDELSGGIASTLASYNGAVSAINDNISCFNTAEALELSEKISELISELENAKAMIDKLKTDGEEAYQKEILRLGAFSRARNDLEFHSVTRAEREFLAFWIGGVYWRMRGGGMIKFDGTQEARIYGLQRPFAVLGKFAGGDDGADPANSLYLAVFNGWGDYMDMGSTPDGEDKYFDLAGMTNRGKEQVAGAVPLLGNKSYDTTALFAGGLEMGPCYYFAYDRLIDFTWAPSMDLPYGGFIDGATSIGEFCSGASIALGFVRTLLNGWATGEPPTCIIDCNGKNCGDDGCGWTCGTCNEGFECSETGICTEIIEPEPDEDSAAPDEEEPQIDNDPDTTEPDEYTTPDPDITTDDTNDPDTTDEDSIPPANSEKGCGCAVVGG